MHVPVKTGIIGCGNIGTELAGFLNVNKNFEVCTLTDVDETKAKELQSKFTGTCPGIVSISDSILHNDLVIEAANAQVVAEILKQRILKTKPVKLLCMSTGGLLGALDVIRKLKNVEFLIPSGAIAGLDAIKAVSAEIKSLSLTTTKPALSLKDAPYIINHNIALDNLSRPTVVFEGDLMKAVAGFPKNINVAASLFLASNFPKLSVTIFAHPNTRFNTHRIKCSGKFGTITTTTRNLPSSNPKTSYLAILSAKAMLSSLCGNTRIGG